MNDKKKTLPIGPPVYRPVTTTPRPFSIRPRMQAPVMIQRTMSMRKALPVSVRGNVVQRQVDHMPHVFFDEVRRSMRGLTLTTNEENEQALQAVYTYAYELPPGNADLTFEALVKRAMDHAPSQRGSLCRMWKEFEDALRLRYTERCEDLLWSLAIFINQLLVRPVEPTVPAVVAVGLPVPLAGPHPSPALGGPPRPFTARPNAPKDHDAWKKTARKVPSVSRNGKTVQAVILVSDFRSMDGIPKRIQVSVDRHTWYALDDSDASRTAAKEKNSLLDATIAEADVITDMREIAVAYADKYQGTTTRLGEFEVKVSSGRSYWLNMSNNEHPHCFPAKGPCILADLSDNEFRAVKALKAFERSTYRDSRTWGTFVSNMRATGVNFQRTLEIATGLRVPAALLANIKNAYRLDKDDEEERVLKQNLLQTQSARIARGKDITKTSDPSKNKLRKGNLPE